MAYTDKPNWIIRVPKDKITNFALIDKLKEQNIPFPVLEQDATHFIVRTNQSVSV